MIGLNLAYISKKNNSKICTSNLKYGNMLYNVTLYRDSQKKNWRKRGQSVENKRGK